MSSAACAASSRAKCSEIWLLPASARAGPPTPSPVIANILAERYASAEMADLFDATNRVRLERELWIAVLEAQTDLGLPLGDGVLDRIVIEPHEGRVLLADRGGDPGRRKAQRCIERGHNPTGKHRAPAMVGEQIVAKTGQ